MEEIRDDVNTEIVSVEPTNTQLVESVNKAVGNVKDKISTKAIEMVDSSESIDRHAKGLAEVADKALRADIEKENLRVERTNAENKTEKQEIKNKLIELKTEAKRLKREQKQLLKEQRADHKRRNKEVLWEIYKGKLEKMGYSYVPNIAILKMLLMIDGIVSFFEGVGKISTAIMKMLKWFIIIISILVVLLIVPTTKDWLLNLLGFIG